MRKSIYIIGIFIVLIFTGCTSKYELKIENGTFTENITTYIYSQDRENDLHDGIESGARIDAMIDHDVFSLFGHYNMVYKKKVKKNSDYEKVVLTQKYSAKEFKNSRAMMECFHKFDFKTTKKYYHIKLYDDFFCLYNNDKLDIIITSKNKVIKANADERKGNKYIWHVNKDNFHDLNIEIKTEKVKKTNYILIILSSLLVVGCIISLVVIIKNKHKSSNKF